MTPCKPHFYIEKLEFTGVYIIFFISAQRHKLWGYSLEPLEAVLTSNYNLCFEQKYEKYQNFLSENFQFLVVKFTVYLTSHVFLMLTNDIVSFEQLGPDVCYIYLKQQKKKKKKKKKKK